MVHLGGEAMFDSEKIRQEIVANAKKKLHGILWFSGKAVTEFHCQTCSGVGTKIEVKKSPADPNMIVITGGTCEDCQGTGQRYY